MATALGSFLAPHSSACQGLGRKADCAVSPSFSSSDIHMASEQPHRSHLASSYPQGSFPPCAQTASPLHHSNASWGSPVKSTKRLQTSPRSTVPAAQPGWCRSPSFSHLLPHCCPLWTQATLLTSACSTWDGSRRICGVGPPQAQAQRQRGGHPAPGVLALLWYSTPDCHCPSRM